jgi:hypothetical protein
LTGSSGIVAVHGLGSNPATAWRRSRSRATWLADFLPTTHKDFRIIAVNHDSRWNAYSPVQGLQDYGQVILDSIAALRLDEEVGMMLLFYCCRAHKFLEQERSRPLILIGHSFGGILIKKALVIAKGLEASSCKLLGRKVY